MNLVPVTRRTPVSASPSALSPVKLVILGGSGDAYLVFSLLGEFLKRHGPRGAVVALRQRLAAVGDLFGLPYEVDDALVASAETNPIFQTTYPNEFGADTPYFVHPCFLRTPVRIDKLTTRWEASQADMYRMLLRLPFDAPLSLPMMERRDVPRVRGSVVMITDSTSWPNTQPDFWPRLADRLRRDEWDVFINDKSESLGALFDHCSRAEWVIGPQCGVMSILVTGEFACRKTLATPNIDGNRRPEYLADETFPYAYVTKFSNNDYDVEEFKITDDNHAELIELIATGRNARGVDHDPQPAMSIMTPLSPGDFFDRFAVLTVKRGRFTGMKRASIEREYQRHMEIIHRLKPSPTVLHLTAELIQLHERCFDTLAGLVPAALSGADTIVENHIEVIRANRKRVELKQTIDVACHAPHGEVKNYYGEK